MYVPSSRPAVALAEARAASPLRTYIRAVVFVILCTNLSYSYLRYLVYTLPVLRISPCIRTLLTLVSYPAIPPDCDHCAHRHTLSSYRHPHNAQRTYVHIYLPTYRTPQHDMVPGLSFHSTVVPWFAVSSDTLWSLQVVVRILFMHIAHRTLHTAPSRSQSLLRLRFVV